MTEPRRDLGENDVRFTGVIDDIGEKSCGLGFAHAPSSGRAVRADVCTLRGANTGFEASQHRPRFRVAAFFPSLDGIPLEAWFIPADCGQAC